MKTKIQIKSITGNILFEYEDENATTKKAVIAAAKKHIRLSSANLFRVGLRHADLRGINLSEANLSGADFFGADLQNANLCYANLCKANFYGANLCEANLRCANLYEADLDGAKNIPYIPLVCPSDGAFIGWKKVNNLLIKLEIPEDAKRSSATTNKCRCDKAKVLAITDLDGTNPIDKVVNTSRIHPVTYEVGEMVYPDSFDEDRWVECSHGIYFFINKQEAIDY